MNVLVCGARGFIGRAVCAALRRAGHGVVEGLSPRAAAAGAGPSTLAIDYARDTDPATWRPRLAGIDVVVNAIGVLRDTAARPIDALQRATPVALFDACAEAGGKRVVQVSALGIDGGTTPYARTKLAAEARLAAHAAAGRLDAAIVRPSIVFGPGGASSALFLNLARLPLVLLPGAVLDARVQPVAVHELAEVLARLAVHEGPVADLARAPLVAVGPRPLTMGAFIASLRQQQGRRAAIVARLPDPLTRLSAAVGDLVPASPWCSDSLAMLATDNVGDPAPFARWLGREATPPERLLAAA